MKTFFNKLKWAPTVLTVLALSASAMAAYPPAPHQDDILKLPQVWNDLPRGADIEYNARQVTPLEMDQTVNRAMQLVGTDVSHSGRRSKWQQHVGQGWVTFTETTTISKTKMYQWVDRAVWVLERASREAMLLYADGATDENKYTQAIGVLVNAFADLSGSMKRTQYYMGPMTKLMIDRGTIVAFDLIAWSDILKADRFTKVGVLNFMFGLIDTVLATEATKGYMGAAQLDKMGYIEMSYGYEQDYYSCGRQGFNSCDNYHERFAYQDLFKQLEYRFVRLANEQLQITNKLIEVHAEPNGVRHGLTERIYPYGPAEIYLIAAEHYTQWAAVDLVQSLHGSKYTCVAGALAELHDELHRFNKAGGSYYGQNVQAMTHSAVDIINRLKADVLSKDSFDQVKKKYRPSFFGYCRDHYN